MPEGPQMVLLKEQVEHFTGQMVTKASGSAGNIPFDSIEGKRLADIKTFGKEIIFCFPDFAVRIHLMLFGKYAIDDELKRVLRLGLEFEGGVINFYACECRFIEEPLDTVYDWSIDVLNPVFNRANALEKLRNKPRQLICEALLDQHIVAGVGNKIKNEVLFRKHVHPESVVGEIDENVLKKLIEECVKFSFEYLGWKREGVDNEHWEVYKKKECPRDNIPLMIGKIGKSGRTCYFCDRCQKLYISNQL
ncbi:MAG TPA: endonuclease [Segetibacter sp.]